MAKQYKVGMYGGKFMPMHKGHLSVLRKAADECEEVWLLMFVNGEQEVELNKVPRDWLTMESRIMGCKRAAAMFPNVHFAVIDVGQCRYEDGAEDWDAETPLVEAVTGKLDAVYGNEPSYAPYFERAYPGAEYRIYDPGRELVPISATMIRAMNEEERKEWIV